MNGMASVACPDRITAQLVEGRWYDGRLAANAGYGHDLASEILIGGKNNWPFEA
jgi:hypothetical protein